MYLFKLTFTYASARCLELFSHLVDLPAIFWFYVTTKLKTKHICVRQVKQLCPYGFLRIFNIHICVWSDAVCFYLCTTMFLFPLPNFPSVNFLNVFFNFLKLFCVRCSLWFLFLAWEVMGARAQKHPCHVTGRERNTVIRAVWAFV